MTDDRSRELAGAVNQTAPMDTREGLLALLKKIEYALRKDSLTDNERLAAARTVVCAAISRAGAIPDPAQAPADRRALTMIAAECHRAKWQFDINDEEPPKAAEARVLVDLAFKTLHRIGDMALNLRDGSVVSSTQSVAPDQTGWLIEKDDPPVYCILSDDYDEHWTPDASKALRFARREDAQVYSDHIGWTSPPVRVVEHMWPAHRSSSLSRPHHSTTENKG